MHWYSCQCLPPRILRAELQEQNQIIVPIRRILTPKAYAGGLLASILASILIVIVMVALGEYTKTRGRMLLTSLVLSAYFLSNMGPVFLAQRRPVSGSAWVSLGTGGAALLLLLTGVWGTPNSDAFWKSTAIVTALGLVLAYVAIVDLEQRRLTNRFAVKAVAVATVLGCFGIAVGIKWPPYWWVFTLTVIVWTGALSASVAFYLVRRIQSP